MRWSTKCCATPRDMRSAGSSPFGFCSGGVTAKGTGKNVEAHDRRGGAPPLRTGGVDLGVGCAFGDAPCITEGVDRESTGKGLGHA